MHSKAALRKAFHVFAAMLAASALFILAGRPYTSQALVQVAILGCLSAIVSDEVEFSLVCLIAMSLAAAIGGITEFLILDGADSFPQLALAMAPGLFVSYLLFCNERTSGVGFISVIYVPNFIEPANPQSYDPQLYPRSPAPARRLVRFVRNWRSRKGQWWRGWKCGSQRRRARRRRSTSGWLLA